MAKNDNCAASDSALCRWIGKDCGECQMSGFKGDDAVKKASEDFKVTVSLLPEDFDELQGDYCQFCKSRKRERAGYALADLGHAEPKNETGMFFGLGKKIRRRVGSIFPLSISICRECRRALRLADGIKWLCAVVVMAAAILVLTVSPLKDTVNEAVLLIIMAAALLLAYMAGKAASAAYVRAKSKDTRFNMFDIPICARMKEAGWFTIQDETPVTRLVFSAKSHTRSIKSITGEERGMEDES